MKRSNIIKGGISLSVALALSGLICGCAPESGYEEASSSLEPVALELETIAEEGDGGGILGPPSPTGYLSKISIADSESFASAATGPSAQEVTSGKKNSSTIVRGDDLKETTIRSSSSSSVSASGSQASSLPNSSDGSRSETSIATPASPNPPSSSGSTSQGVSSSTPAHTHEFNIAIYDNQRVEVGEYLQCSCGSRFDTHEAWDAHSKADRTSSHAYVPQSIYETNQVIVGYKCSCGKIQ